MENATKALLIAAAVLVAIIIISLTLGVVNQGREAISSADMSVAQITAFNSKFKAYEGKNLSTSEVNALLDTVFTHNQAQTNTGGTSLVKVSGSATLATNAKEIKRLTGSAYYTAACVYTKGLVTEIKITASK